MGLRVSTLPSNNEFLPQQPETRGVMFAGGGVEAREVQVRMPSEVPTGVAGSWVLSTEL